MIRKWRRAFTIPELLISMTVASVLLVGGYVMIGMAGDVYKRVSGHEDGALQMKKASRRIQKDLLASNIDLTSVVPCPGPVGNAGDAICLLSTNQGADATGPTSATAGGDPYWQRNIIYYPARPTNDTCPGGANGDGYEDMCPHKIIIRKVIDNPPETRPIADGGTPAMDREDLLTDGAIATYLTRPGALSVAGMMTEPEVTAVEVVAVNVLTMRAQKNPDPNATGEILVTFQTFNEDSARKTTNIGTTNLGNHADTQTHLLSVFPRNVRGEDP